MAKVIMIKASSVDGLDLYAAIDADSEKRINGVQEFIFDYKKNRSAANHRRFFAFIQTAFDMQDTYDNKEVFRKYLEMLAGHFDTVIAARTGEAMYWPKSINWDSLDEDEFRKLFTEVVNAFLGWYGQKLDDMQINQLVGF